MAKVGVQRPDESGLLLHTIPKSRSQLIIDQVDYKWQNNKISRKSYRRIPLSLWGRQRFYKQNTQKALTTTRGKTDKLTLNNHFC